MSTAAAPERAPQPDSDDTIFIANLPVDFTKEDLETWCSDTFTKGPSSVRVRKPRARNGEQPTVRFGFLHFDEASIASATLDLITNSNAGDDPFVINDIVIDAKWAKAQRPRKQQEGGAAGGDGKKKRRRNRKTGDNATGDAGNNNNNNAGGGGDANASGKKKRNRRRKKGKATEGGADAEGGANAEPEPEPEPEDMTGRVYAKNFADEAALRSALEAHGALSALEVKEVRRGPGAGSIYAFATFETQESADAAVAALGVAEGAEPAEGQLLVALAKPRVVRKRAAKKKGTANGGRARTSIKLEEPSELDLCCRNLPYAMDDTGLREIFSKFGSVESARVITRGGRSRGYGFVHFTDAAEAKTAQEYVLLCTFLSLPVLCKLFGCFRAYGGVRMLMICCVRCPRWGDECLPLENLASLSTN